MVRNMTEFAEQDEPLDGIEINTLVKVKPLLISRPTSKQSAKAGFDNT